MRVNRISEDTRRRSALVTAWTAWAAALSLTVFRVVGVFEGPHPIGAVIILLIGVAVTATMARSRYKLKEAIVGAFEAGLRAADTDRQRVADALHDDLKERTSSNGRSNRPVA